MMKEILPILHNRVQKLSEPQIIMICMMHSDKKSCSSEISGLSVVRTFIIPVNP